MVHFNKVTILGTLEEAPIFSGTSEDLLGQFMIGTALRFVNRENQEVTETQWFRVSFFGETAHSLLETNLAQGDKIYLEGRLSIFEYIQEGVNKTSIEIFGDQFAALDSSTNPKLGNHKPDPDDLPLKNIPDMTPEFP